MEEELLVFFKALVDVDRLKIIGLLALEPLTTQEMASRLQVRPVAVVRHLDYLVHAGLVRNEASIYRLDTHALKKRRASCWLMKSNVLLRKASRVRTLTARFWAISSTRMEA